MLVFETLKKQQKKDSLNSNTCFCSRLYGKCLDREWVEMTILFTIANSSFRLRIYIANKMAEWRQERLASSFRYVFLHLGWTILISKVILRQG